MLLKEISLEDILPAWSQLRPVREDTVEFLELVDSIRSSGILNSIAVRPHPTREGLYEVIDGMWRWTACLRLHRQDIPCIVLENISNARVLELQIEANAITYETRPVEFAYQMQKVIKIREEVGAAMTLKELAGTVGKSVSWVSDRLNLLKLHKDLQEEISEGRMGIGKGTALAKIKRYKHQISIWEEHKEKNTRDFQREVGRFLQNIYADLDEAYNEERETLRPRIQTMDSLLIELDRLEQISKIIVSKGLTTAIQGAKIALEWTLNLHDAGREKQLEEKRFLLTQHERQQIIGAQRYEELKALTELREQRQQRSRDNFN